MLFKSPSCKVELPKVIIGVGIILIVCILSNLINAATASLYRKTLRVIGNEGSANIEIFRRSAREMLSTPVAMNLVLKYLENGNTKMINKNQLKRQGFSASENQLLSELGIQRGEKAIATSSQQSYEKIIVIVAESLHRDFLHFYNPRIPAEATPFFDSLCAQYPRLDNYYTSARPTTPGLNAMFLSQLLYSPEQGFGNNTSIFRILTNNGYNTVFLSASSQYYNDEFRDYKKQFGMQNYRAREDLSKQGYLGSSGWGFHNDVMYEETIRILENNRNNKLFLVTKTLDFHQPEVYSGIADEKLPLVIQNASNQYLKGVFWENISLQKFFQDLQEHQLLDEKTLIVITGDHNPHPSQGPEYKSLATEELFLRLGPLPLIFISKNSQPFANMDSKKFASQIDFAPTILHLLGIAAPEDYMGTSILSTPTKYSYAIGQHDGTIFYKSSEQQIAVQLVDSESQSKYDYALRHWVQSTSEPGARI